MKENNSRHQARLRRSDAGPDPLITPKLMAALNYILPENDLKVEDLMSDVEISASVIHV